MQSHILLRPPKHVCTHGDVRHTFLKSNHQMGLHTVGPSAVQARDPKGYLRGFQMDPYWSYGGALN